MFKARRFLTRISNCGERDDSANFTEVLGFIVVWWRDKAQYSCNHLLALMMGADDV